MTKTEQAENEEEEEKEGKEGQEANHVKKQAVFDAEGHGNVDTKHERNQPQDEEQQKYDDVGGLSGSEMDLRNHLRDDILETVR